MLMAVVAVVLLRQLSIRSGLPSLQQGDVRVVTVKRVLDGDTIDCADGTRVRLLGIEAPEVAHGDQPGEAGGAESTAWLRDLSEGKSVSLHPGPEPTDRYGRTLSWVYSNDGELVNLQILEAGQARLLPDYGLPADLEPRLRRAEAMARMRELGIWSD
jgi:micrococcal nuclease